jgi:S1-C subfamily serine protease
MSRITVSSAFLLLIGLFLGSVNAQQVTSFDTERIERATVFVMQARNVGDNLLITCIGSGTLVSRDGLILTNAHNTLVSEGCPGETLVIAMTTRPDEPPIAKFRAEIAQADPGVDIALLRITRELDGRLVDPQSLALPFVNLADSSSVRLDETITIAGYPGVGDDPVTVARGTVNGFVVEPTSFSSSNAAWIKTSAVIPGTMSGGGAYNQAGELIGIPTTAPVTAQSTSSTCLFIQDTNNDGLVTSSDTCIAIGGFINSLRPSNFARPLVRAASLRLAVEPITSLQSRSQPSGTPGFKRLFFSPSVNEAGMATSVIRSLPAGSNSLYLFFDYENMSPETVYELRVTTNGQPSADFSLAPVRWSGGERGMWYIGSNDRPWPNGTYEFILFANGVATPNSTARLVIGGSPSTDATFGDVAFGVLDLRDTLLGNGFVLPSGGNIASARFIFRNLENGVNWTPIWYLNGTEIPNSRQTNPWIDGNNGSATTNILSESGLPPGSYRLELYIEDRLAATSDFVVAGAQQGAFPEVFSNIHFTTADSPDEALSSGPISNFPPGVNELYMLFDWQQIAPRTLWTMRLSVDDEVFYEQTVPWSGAESGEDFLVRLGALPDIADGTYKVELLLNNVLLGSTQVQVGIGQLPIDRFADASGVQMRGTVLDANTRKGIPGVTFVLISKDFSVEEFTATWDQNQVYALATTDRNGYFEIDRPLEISTEDNPVLYSALIAAEGYLPVSADGLEVTDETENPLNMTIYLTRD